MSWKREWGRLVAPVLAVIASVLMLLTGLLNQHHPKPQPQTPSPAAHPVGFAVPQLPFLDPTDLDRQLAGIHALGATWIRIDLPWSMIQPAGPSSYDWARYDRVVQAAGRHQLKVDGVIDYTAAWARLPVCAEHFQCQPRNAQLFADFAGAVARHFRGTAVAAMEIWNEPNIRQFWLPSPNAAFYRALLTASDRAIKAVDPDYTVITGGLAPASSVSGSSYSPLDFLDQLYHYGGRGAFDAIGYHPYSYPNLPSSFNVASSFSQLEQTPRSLRSIVAAHGDAHVPIWLTEVGAPTGGPGPSSTCGEQSFSVTHTVVSECLQAKLLSDALCQASRAADLGPTFIYSFQDQGTDPASIENFFGLLRADGSRKPSYQAVAEAISHPCR